MSPVISAILAYAIWGFVPLFWHYLEKVPADELIGHRIFWSLLCMLPFLGKTRWQGLLPLWKKSKFLLFSSSLLIGGNWWLYVWAVNHGYVVESSLGYFINPLLNVAVGVIFFQEKMRKAQWLACSFALLGVSCLILLTGQIPWVAFALALSFCLYGYARKILHADTLSATFLESLILVLPAGFWLAQLLLSGQARATTAPAGELFAITLSGLVTTLPLLLFADAVKKLPFSTIGFLQFLSPSLQFLLGVFVFREPFDTSRLLCFVVIWIGLALFAWDLRQSRKK